MHKKNVHINGYDFKKLRHLSTDLDAFVFENDYGKLTIDFANPKAVKVLNTTLLSAYYDIGFWEFPDHHLCPPIPGRVDYIHQLNDLLLPYQKTSKVKVLDIGTGATCIYPLLGYSVYEWQFVGTDIDKEALKNSQHIIDKNYLSQTIALRLQNDKTQILKSIIQPEDKFSLSMCNPPFYKSEEEALQATIRKLKGLGKASEKIIRNFSGTANELWFEGGEKAFLHTYLYESSLYKAQCLWFTSLVSNKDLLKSMQKSLNKLGATQVKVINMQQGNKLSRIVAWTFLSEAEQKEWST